MGLAAFSLLMAGTGAAIPIRSLSTGEGRCQERCRADFNFLTRATSPSMSSGCFLGMMCSGPSCSPSLPISLAPFAWQAMQVCASGIGSDRHSSENLPPEAAHS